MKKKRIVVFTAARSDFGVMKKTIIRLNNHKNINLTLLIGPAHYSNSFGYTIKEINKIKLSKVVRLNFSYSSNSNMQNILQNFSKIMLNTQKFFEKKKIDCVMIMGDRYEMMAVSLVCINNNIPIAHICGGSETIGSIDNEYRNSISQMSKFHFVETKFHKKKLNRMGIKKNVFVVGAPALENQYKNIKNFLLVKNKFFSNLDKNKKIIVACFHPETTETLSVNLRNLKILISFLNKLNNFNIIFTYPNADIGYEKFIKLLKKKLNKKIFLQSNLGINNYYTVLGKATMLIGNSSSGIIETASFNLPTINLGDRQKNRYAPKNVYHCPFNLEKLNRLFNKLLNQKKFRLQNPYYKKNTSLNIVKKLKNLLK